MFGIGISILMIIISLFAFSTHFETLKPYPIKRKNAMTLSDIQKLMNSMKKEHLRKE